jgi:putative chitinase
LKFKFTKEQLREILRGNPDSDRWFEACVAIFPKYDIITEARVAGFLAQCAHESNNFRSLEENLNYREETLLRVFPRYFGPGKENARLYANNPEKLANYVYMDVNRSPRGALGNTQPGDGWRFRGRGLKQLTGRNNYAAFGSTVGMTAEEAAIYVATEKGAIESACWFWKQKKLNEVADTKDIVKMTKIINGGDIGLADRTQRFDHALKVLNANFTPSAPITKSSAPIAKSNVVAPKSNTLNLSQTVRKGSKGPIVVAIQQALGITSDGSFGPGTERALKAWQSKNGLVADGVAGPKTLASLLK